MTVARVPMGGAQHRRPGIEGLARHRFVVGLAKRVLPLIALALLALMAVWPELDHDGEGTRLALRRMTAPPESGELTDPRYRGVDTSGQPYTITAARARQAGDNRTTLVAPKADLTTNDGAWVQLQAQNGVYLPKDGHLDLSGAVQLYRDDGLTVDTDAATVDLRAGAAASADKVHAEGPFGTLDAQGFAVLDRGALVQFTGPGRLVLRGAAP